MLWLVGQLPQDSAFAASVRGGAEFRPWTSEMYVLTAVANLLNAANRQRAGKKTREPLIKPPASKKRKPRVLSVAQIAARQRAARNN